MARLSRALVRRFGEEQLGAVVVHEAPSDEPILDFEHIHHGRFERRVVDARFPARARLGDDQVSLHNELFERDLFRVLIARDRGEEAAVLDVGAVTSLALRDRLVVIRMRAKLSPAVVLSIVGTRPT